MKKIVVLCGIISLCTLTAAAQTARKKITISNTRIVQATQNIALTYGGVKMVVPQGQTVMLGMRSDGFVIVRGKDLSGVQIENGTVSTQGYSVFSVMPKSDIVFLNRGTELTLQDPTGATATIYPGQAVYTENAAITSQTAPALQTAAAKEAAAIAEIAEAEDVPAFVAESETTSTASEQAAQDVVETEELSPSAP